MATIDEPNYEGLAVKKLRRAPECIVTMILRDSEVLYDFLLPDPDAEVVCLSQTVRRVGEVGDRVAVIVPSTEHPIPWHQCLLPSVITSWVQSVMCCEAFKILEVDFTELLRSYLDKPLCRETLTKLGPAINHSSKSLKQPIDSPLMATFGIFAIALVMLHDMKPRNDKEKQKLVRQVALGKKLFMEIVEEGICTLKNTCDAESVELDTQRENAFASMCNHNNFEATIREWGAASAMWADRNAFFHPFTSLTNDEERVNAIQYYGSLVDTPYCKAFRNVAVLGKVHLKILDVKELSKFGVDDADMDSLIL